MPRLILLRHAKSDWETGAGSDIERPLSARGRRNAASIGRFLAASGEVPDSIVRSPARRAGETVELLLAAGGFEPPVRVAELLYDGGVGALVREIAAEPTSTELLLAVGHEPTWSLAASLLSGGSQLRFATGAMACLELASWTALGGGAAVLEWFLPPRLIESSLSRPDSDDIGSTSQVKERRRRGT